MAVSLPEPPGEQVRALVAGERVGAAAAGEQVVAGTAAQRIVGRIATHDQIVAELARGPRSRTVHIVVGAVDDRVAPKNGRQVDVRRIVVLVKAVSMLSNWLPVIVITPLIGPPGDGVGRAGLAEADADVGLGRERSGVLERVAGDRDVGQDRRVDPIQRMTEVVARLDLQGAREIPSVSCEFEEPAGVLEQRVLDRDVREACRFRLMSMPASVPLPKPDVSRLPLFFTSIAVKVALDSFSA